MKTVWIVVADDAYARIFSSENRVGKTLTEVEDIVHPESRLRESELRNEDRGRSWSPTGEGRHAMEEPTPPHDKEREIFACELAGRIHKGYEEDRFRHLLIVAPARFLGALRKQLDAQVAKTVSAEVAKDIVRERPEAIRQHLPDFLY